MDEFTNRYGYTYDIIERTNNSATISCVECNYKQSLVNNNSRVTDDEIMEFFDTSYIHHYCTKIKCENCEDMSNEMISFDKPVFYFKCYNCNITTEKYVVECQGSVRDNCNEDCDEDCEPGLHDYVDCSSLMFASFDNHEGKCDKCKTEFEMLEILKDYKNSLIAGNDTDLACTECNDWDTDIIRTLNLNSFICLGCTTHFNHNDISTCDRCGARHLGPISDCSALEGCMMCPGYDKD